MRKDEKKKRIKNEVSDRRKIRILYFGRDKWSVRFKT